jgi:hypothetical protein
MATTATPMRRAPRKHFGTGIMPTAAPVPEPPLPEVGLAAELLLRVGEDPPVGETPSPLPVIVALGTLWPADLHCCESAAK